MNNRNFLENSKVGEYYKGYARILAKRKMGKISFWTVRFKESTVQFVLKSEKLSNYKKILKIPVGSLVKAEGRKIVTKAGAPSLEVVRITPVYIFNRPWLDKFHGLKPEMRYKNRILDLIINSQTFEAFKKVSDITGEIRKFLLEKGYREFNTGVLQENFEAGQASAFQTICNANDKILYLSLTSELKLKRLIVAGYEKVYEIAQSFRNEGIDSLHSPEFTLLEIYGVSEDYLSMMELTEEIVKKAMQKIEDINIEKKFLADSFKRINFYNAFQKYVGKEECSLNSMIKLFPDMFNENMTNFTWLMKVIEKLIAPRIQQPTFLTELPIDMSPFAKAIDDKRTERAFFIANGLFIADIYTDENDPAAIERALKKQAQEIGATINQDYLETIKMGLPKTAGIGMGLNRLFMALIKELRSNIKETILYPII